MKRRFAYGRTRLAPLYRARHGAFDAEDLRRELAARLPADVEILMVHCSLNDLKPMYIGTANDLLEIVLELAGPACTVAMPTFFFGGPDGDPVAHYRRRPMFDVRRQPSQMGLLSELFRRRVGVQRSLHPTLSVCALGPMADELVRDHHVAGTSYGEGTPFAVMAAHRTAIVGIGTDYFRCLTQVHAAEDLLGHRYPLQVRHRHMAVQLKDFDGCIHSYDLPLNEPHMTRRMELLERLLGPDELVRWRFHGVPLFVTSAARVTEALLDAALHGETIYEALPIGGNGSVAPRARKT